MAKKKKSAKSSQKSKSVITFHEHTSTVRSIIALLIVMLGGSIVLLFKTYKDNIVGNNMFYPFMSLTVIALALLVSLLFLMNPAKRK